MYVEPTGLQSTSCIAKYISKLKKKKNGRIHQFFRSNTSLFMEKSRNEKAFKV